MKHFTQAVYSTPALRSVFLGGLLLVLVGCGATAKEQAVIAQASAAEAQRAQQEQEEAAQARAAQERARIARVEAERARQEAAAQATRLAQTAAAAEAEAAAKATAQREEAARLVAAEQARRAAIAAREQDQLERIAALEAQIAQMQISNARAEAANRKLEDTIAAAEALLDALNAEQLKYSNTNAAGQLLAPLEKARIADLEARKNSLKREAQVFNQ